MKIIPKNIRHFLGDLEGRSSGHLLILAAKWSEARGLANGTQETMAQEKGSPAQLRGNSESKVGKLRVDRLADIALIILHSRESRMVVGYGAA